MAHFLSGELHITVRVEGKYKVVEELEESVEGFVRFIRRCGMTWIIPPLNLPYSLFVPVYSFLGIGHLVYSLTHYTHSLGDMAIIVHFSLLCSTAIVINVVIFPLRTNFRFLITNACRSYDYGGETMRKIQEEYLLTKKTKFSKISHYQIILHVSLMGNLICTSLIDKFVLGQKAFTLYPSWFPSFIPSEVVAVGLTLYGLEVVAMALAGFAVFSAFGTTHFIYTHVSSEFELFCRALGVLRERARELAAERGLLLRQAYARAVRDSSEHHRIIVEYFNVVLPVGQILYTFIYFYGLMLLICTGAVLNSNNITAIMKFVVITMIELFFLYTVSWFSEEMAEKGRVANASVYDIDWFVLPPESVSTLKILLVGSQRTMVMKTYFGQVINLDSYMVMLKAAYSYFNMMLLN